MVSLAENSHARFCLVVTWWLISMNALGSYNALVVSRTVKLTIWKINVSYSEFSRPPTFMLRVYNFFFGRFYHSFVFYGGFQCLITSKLLTFCFPLFCFVLFLMEETKLLNVLCKLFVRKFLFNVKRWI